MKKYMILFAALLFLSSIITAQFRVEEITIKGELTNDDPLEPSFGRFDAVELYLNKGDVISITITAEYPPFIALVAPSEKHYVEYTEDGNSITNYVKNISETGTWYLSIAGDSTDFGKYELTVNYMSANSAAIPFNADYCTSLKFLIEHSKVNFFFMKKAAKVGDEILWEPKVNITGVIDGSIIESIEGEYKYSGLMFESGNKESAQTFYKNLIDSTQKCLGNEWLSNSKNSGSIKQKIFALKDKEVKKKIAVMLKEEQKKYSVYVELNRAK